MARQTPANQVEMLKAKQKALMDELREAQARARADEAEARRKRHEIAGSIVMQELEANPDSPAAMAFRELLDLRVTTESKRALFSLPPRTKAKDDGSAA